MAYNFSSFTSRAKEISDWLSRELAAIRTGRATPTLLDSVQVESYGARMPLKHIGSITIEDPRTLKITLWDKTQVKTAESAIAAANLGVTALADGLAIRVIFPELTADKRKLLSKLVHEKLEEAKVTLRKERERVWNDIQTQERDGQVTEDDKFRLKDELQKLVEESSETLEAQVKRKDEEILN